MSWMGKPRFRLSVLVKVLHLPRDRCREGMTAREVCVGSGEGRGVRKWRRMIVWRGLSEAVKSGGIASGGE